MAIGRKTKNLSEKKEISPSEKITKLWPNWKVKKQIGRGSYGVVYHAVREDAVTSEAAIKVISIPQNQAEMESLRSENMDEDASRTYFGSVKDNFIKEIQIMQSLKSAPNIVIIEDYAVDKKEDGIGWDILIRMELLAPLNNYIATHIMTEKKVIKLGCDICAALEDCSRKYIIHRDIKPENIFINEFDTYKLGDFGIARTMSNLSSGMSQKGTQNYMAPEIARREKYDARVDIYSLGIVLYRMLNGNRMPFIDSDEMKKNPYVREAALECRLSGGELPAPCMASKEMANVILRACAFRREYRFASAAEMKQALQEVKDGTYVIVPIPKEAWNTDVKFELPDISELYPPVTDEPEKETEVLDKNDDPGATQVLNQNDDSGLTEVLDPNNPGRRSGNHWGAPETDASGGRQEKPKKEKTETGKPKKLLWLILLLILLIGLAMTVIPNLLEKDTPSSKNNGQTVSGTFRMPNVEGYTFEDAKELLQELSPNLKVIKDGEEYSTEKAGTVIMQYPKANSDVLKTGTIKLTLSAGPEPEATPTEEPVNTPEPTAAPTAEPTEAPVEPTAEPTPTEIPHEHTWTVQETPATCTTSGLTVEVCECGEQQNSTIIPATGHNVEKKVTKEATVKEEGAWEEVCTVCSEVVNTGSIEKVKATPTPTKKAAPTKTPTPTPTNTPKPTSTPKATPTPAGTAGLKYQSSGNGYVVSGIGTAKGTEIIIPSQYDGKAVTGIAKNAFKDQTKIQKVTIPTSVTSIGDYAFYGCTSLKEIDIPEGVKTIGARAFANCSALKTVTIPSTVTSMGDYCFLDTKKLTKLNFNAKACTTYPTKGAFGYAGSESGGFQLVVGKDVTIIPDYFMAHKDNEVYLTDITYKGKNIKKIGAYAFANCQGLYEIEIPESNKEITIGEYAYYNCLNAKSLTVSSTVKDIKQNAFSLTKGLTSIEFNAVSCNECPGTGIFKEAGWDSHKIDVTFGAKVEKIPGNLFCPGSGDSSKKYPFITSVTIMGNVKEIGANAFAYCKELKSVTMVIGSGWSWKVGTTTITGLDDAATAAKHLTGEYAGGTWKKTK